MILTKATKKHIPALVAISKSAFDTDITVGASSVGGPPEYDSIEWHVEVMNPNVTKWCLDTPIWNKRTNNFYKKIGYIEESKDAKTVYYQKTIDR